MSCLDYSLASSRRGAAPTGLELNRRLAESGGAGLADVDLLTLVVGGGRGPGARERLLRLLEAVGWRGLLSSGEAASWRTHLTAPEARRLSALVELARRLGGGEGALATVVRTPEDVHEATADLRHRRREHFIGLYLNTRNRLIAREEISVGSLNASIVHPREVFEPALRHGAASLVVVHNHPSGETDPSGDDLAITRRLAEAGSILGIALVDHVVVGRHGYTSLREAGHF